MHVIHLILDGANELTLGAAPVQVVAGSAGFKIYIPAEIIREKTHAYLEGD